MERENERVTARGRSGRSSVERVVRACATLFRAHDTIRRARDLSGTRYSGVRDTSPTASGTAAGCPAEYLYV